MVATAATIGIDLGAEYADPPTDFLEAASYAYGLSKDPEHNPKGLMTLSPTYGRYEARYGPGAWGRDYDLHRQGINLILGHSLVSQWSEDGPLTSVDEMSKKLEASYEAESRTVLGENEFWRKVAPLMPPKPKDNALMGVWNATARPIVQRAWDAASNTDPNPTSTDLILLRDTRTMETADEDYVIGGGVLTRKAKLLLYAKSGAGKTTLLDHMAASLASGRPFLGRHAIDRPHRVLFVQGELSHSEIATHGQDILANFEGTDAEDNLAIWPMTQMYLPEGAELLREKVREHRADILIVDPFNRFFAGDNSTQPEQVNQLFRCLDQINEDPDLDMSGVIVAHHMNVAGIRAAGSYTFEAWPSTILRMEEVAGLPTVRKITYEKVRAPGSTLRGTSVQIELTDDGYLIRDAATGHTEPFAGPYLVQQCLEEMAGQAYRDEIIERLMPKANIKRRSAATYLSMAVDQGLVKKLPRDGHGTPYALIPRATASE